jgi:hypothetical protein
VTVGTPGTAATLTSVEGPPDATVSRVVEGGVGNGSVTNQALFESVGPTDRNVTLLTVQFSEPVARGDLSLSSDVRDANEEPVAASRVSLVVGSANPFPDGVPGVVGENPPTDPLPGPGFEDVNGDGTRTLDDVFAFVFGPLAETDGSSLSDAQLDALDYNDDGELTLDDAFTLAFRTG